MDFPTYESLGESPEWIRNLLFAGVFIQENKLHTVMDRYNEMSSKQWLLIAVTKAFDTPPDLTSLAKVMGCSRQNVKKLAQNLERDGYITLDKSPRDARTLCISLTEKGMRFRRDMSALAGDVHAALFQELTEDEIMEYYRLSVKLMHGIDHLETFFQNKEQKR